MKYYPISKKWRKIKPHLEDKIVADTLVADFNKFTYGTWRRDFLHGMKPHEFEGCDWWLDHRGRFPQYWYYVKHAACHWLVNFNLEVAKRVEPKKQWRIVTSREHSTVWDGEETLFDFNFLALGVPPDEAWKLANKKHLKPGKHLITHVAEFYIDRVERERMNININ